MFRALVQTMVADYLVDVDEFEFVGVVEDLAKSFAEMLVMHVPQQIQ